eukprot:3715320-Prymnesium_polylepis.1
MENGDINHIHDLGGDMIELKKRGMKELEDVVIDLSYIIDYIENRDTKWLPELQRRHGATVKQPRHCHHCATRETREERGETSQNYSAIDASAMQ